MIYPTATASPYSFSDAKKIAKTLFNENRKTLYCSCKYSVDNQVDLASCNMQSAYRLKRARRIEWEHIMAAETFGRQHRCWHKKICIKGNGKAYKGRKCCEKIDRSYKQAESELYNLWPEVGLLNQERSNFQFSNLATKKEFYGCKFYINKISRNVEPDDSAKGIVARANLFMAYKYHIQLSHSELDLFKSWNKKFPPTNWEKTWAQKINTIEGYSNLYISSWQAQ